MSTKPRRHKFRLGDRVRFALGQHKVDGVIVEEMGPGAGERRLFRVEIPIDPDEPMRMALVDDDLEPLPPGPEPVTPLDKEKVIEYLVYGGLISILQENFSGKGHHPRAWLRPDTLGNITHTFVPERGFIGGQVVPVRAIHDFKVRTDKRDEVVAFVESFGLTRREAEKVVSEVGTAS
jgi:hypothetical protein